MIQFNDQFMEIHNHHKIKSASILYKMSLIKHIGGGCGDPQHEHNLEGGRRRSRRRSRKTKSKTARRTKSRTAKKSRKRSSRKRSSRRSTK